MAPVSECSESAVSFDPPRKRTMKIAVHLVVGLWAAVSCGSAQLPGKPEEQSSEVSRLAAAQLQRLAPFRRSGLEGGLEGGRPRKKPPAEAPDEDEFHFKIPLDLGELLRIFGPGGEAPAKERRNDAQFSPDKLDKLNKYADKLMQDARVQRYMQERIKRDGYGGGYGGYGGYGGHGGGSDSGGSGAFVSGIAGQLVGSVVGLSTSSSKGSSSSSGHSPAPVYGPPAYPSYGKESFNIWDFKRAILNTLIQAVKAIGGGVLALKGQLIKGGGFLVSTKGRIISSAGQAITGLGKNLASSAVVQPPPSYSHPGYGYAYEAPHVIAHDGNYNGPPPSPDAYHTTFGAASDEDSVHQPGLLLAKPTPEEVHSEVIETEHLQSDQYDIEHHGAEHHQPEPISVEHEVPQKENYVKDVVSQLTHASNLYKNKQNRLKPPENHDIEETPAIPANTLQLQEHNQDNYEVYPPLGTGPPDDQTFQQPPKHDSPPVNFNSPPVDFNSPPVDFNSPPVNLQNNYHTLPVKYDIPSVDYHQQNYLPPQPYLENHRQPAIQIEISDHDITGFETGGYGYAQRRLPPGLHVVAMKGPLKIPIIGPASTYYKPGAFPFPHMNSLHAAGKYGQRYGPSFQFHQTIGYDQRKRRDGIKLQRI